MLASSPDSPGSSHRHADGTHHLVQFYESEEFLSQVVSDFLGQGLAIGEPALVIATEPHRRAFAQRLAERGFDVEAARGSGRLVMIDAQECLDQLMVGPNPDWPRFTQLLEPMIQAAQRTGDAGRVRAYGEMVDLLWQQGNPLGAIRLEELWNDLGRKFSFTLLCAYVMGNFFRGEHAEPFDRICQTHSEVYPTEKFSRALPAESQLAEVASLQQRARALETELAHRKELERGLREALAERRRAEQALQASREELADFLENAAEGVHAVGPDGIIRYANRAELELLGYQAEEYVGHPIADFHVDAEVIADILSRLRKNETLRGYESRLRCKDGSIKYVQISSNVAFRDGQFLHTRCFSRDVTERRRLQEELLRRNDELSRAVHFSELFVGVLGHDLRNPLSAVTTTASLLTRRGDPEVVTRAKRILNSAGRMARMIDQLLDFTRIRVGSGFALQRRRFDLTEVCQDVIEELTAERRPDAVRFDSTGEPVGDWDHDRIAQLISNLLGNALSHGDGEHPIDVRLDATHPDEVTLEIANRGAIPEEVLPTLFEPLKPGVKRPGSSGVGLGLYISRQIARAHAGELLVRSDSECTAFTVKLPRRERPNETGP